MDSISEISHPIGNPMLLLIERGFWLLLGIFLVFALGRAFFQGNRNNDSN
tara:strand:+ start:246 stop:395 length:150 start_codon:yes stop_codon:yes gene_type:complete